jgi:ketosteroid isomerase-like protein
MDPLRFRCLSFLVFMILFIGASSEVSNSQTNLASSTGDPIAIQALRNVINEYAKSVDSLDLSLARKVWSAGPEVTFIHPRGTERGLEQILQNFYGNTMGTFSKRQLLPDQMDIHVYDDTAWSEFTWTFHATVRASGQNITTQGRETQVYHKENGTWRIVHVHYSGMPVS